MPGIRESIIEFGNELTYRLVCEHCGLDIQVSVNVGGRSEKQRCSSKCITGCNTLDRVRDRAYNLIRQFSGPFHSGEGSCTESAQEGPRPQSANNL